jgi:stage V sporulation protein S
MATADIEVDHAGEESILRVKANSSAQSVASALAHAIYDSRKVKLRAIGAGAVNQSVKALAIARGYVAPRGIDLAFRPGFETVHMPSGGPNNEGEDISAIVFHVTVLS